MSSTVTSSQYSQPLTCQQLLTAVFIILSAVISSGVVEDGGRRMAITAADTWLAGLPADGGVKVGWETLQLTQVKCPLMPRLPGRWVRQARLATRRWSGEVTASTPILSLSILSCLLVVSYNISIHLSPWNRSDTQSITDHQCASAIHGQYGQWNYRVFHGTRVIHNYSR